MKQTVGALAVLVFSFVATSVIGLALEKTIGFRLEKEAEMAGIDLQEHAESGYDISGVSGGRFGASGAVTTAPSAKISEGASA